MVTFGEREITKERFDAARRPLKIWYINVDNIFFSKLIKTKTNSKYLARDLDKAIKPFPDF